MKIMLSMILCQNALSEFNMKHCLASAWLRETSTKFLGFFLSDWLSFLNFRGTIKPGPFVLEKSRNTCSLPCSKSEAVSHPPFASHSRAAAFWFQQPLSEFLHTQHSRQPGKTWMLLSILCTVTSQTISAAFSTLFPPTFQVTPPQNCSLSPSLKWSVF